MTRILLFAAASLLVVGVAPQSRAGEALQLKGGCLEILNRTDCPYQHPPPPPPPQDFPADAHPGQCFAQVRTPATYETYSEQVLVRPGQVIRHHTAPVYEWGEKQVLVEAAHIERHVIPATYRSVTETEVVSAATERFEEVAAVYETVTEKVLVRQAHSEWRRTFVGPDGFLPAGARVEPTGEVVCLVEIPAEYDHVQRQVLRRAASTVRIAVPAVTRMVTRQVIDQPSRVVEHAVAAVYRTEKFRRMVSPGGEQSETVAPVYETRTRQRMVSSGSTEWRQVDCSIKDLH